VSDVSSDEADCLSAAYAYGELDETSSRQVERFLLTHREYRVLLEEHRRIAAAVGSMARRPAPKETIDRILERLRREPATVANAKAPDGGRGSAAGGKRPFGELLTAYVDGEVPEYKRRRVEVQAARDARVQRLLSSFERIHEALSHLPRQEAPAGLLAKCLDRIRETSAQEEAEPILLPDEAPARQMIDESEWRAAAPHARLERPSGLAAALVWGAACAVLVAVACFYVAARGRWDVGAELGRGLASAPSAGGSRAAGRDSIRLDAGPPPAAASETTIDLERLAAIAPDALAGEIDEKQVVVSAHDVDQVLRELETTLHTLSFSPASVAAAPGDSDPAYVVELHGAPGQVSRVLDGLREMGRRGELLRQVGIHQPSPPGARVAASVAGPPVEPGGRMDATSHFSRPIRIFVVIQPNSTP
jgi:anti-sigma factor RsiW